MSLILTFVTILVPRAMSIRSALQSATANLAMILSQPAYSVRLQGPLVSCAQATMSLLTLLVSAPTGTMCQPVIRIIGTNADFAIYPA